MPVVRFWLTHREELAALVAEHVLLVAIATMAAVAIGVPLGVFATRRPRLAAPLVGIANVVQTVPSLAMFGFLLPVPLIGGVGARAALVVLVLYALLPILRSTIVGITGIDRSVREAGLAMGMTERELLRQVELPLALPSIIAGVRVAAVVGVGSATIAACRWSTRPSSSRERFPRRCWRSPSTAHCCGSNASCRPAAAPGRVERRWQSPGRSRRSRSAAAR
jgi:osmoprotectant transport system permease protein